MDTILHISRSLGSGMRQMIDLLRNFLGTLFELWRRTFYSTSEYNPLSGWIVVYNVVLVMLLCNQKTSSSSLWTMNWFLLLFQGSSVRSQSQLLSSREENNYLLTSWPPAPVLPMPRASAIIHRALFPRFLLSILEEQRAVLPNTM